MKCDYFSASKCHSCNLLDKSYSDSLLLKENHLKTLFPHHAGLMKPTIGLQNSVASSRNKVKLAVFLQNDQITFGVYSRDGVPRELENCPLHAEGINALLPDIREVLHKFNIVPYNLQSKTGELKFLIISMSGDVHRTECMLRFVLRSKNSFHALKKSVSELLEISPAIKVITANIQPIHQAVLEGEEEIILSNDSFIIHPFDEFKLALGAKSFFQVTPQIALALYNAVAEAISIDQPLSLLDLYCGVGVFSFYASRYCVDITGIEISKEAIECANYSANLNNTKINFAAQDAEEFLKQNYKTFDAILINPPRRGLNSAIIEIIKQISPRFIYYSSCNAATMARDFEEMKDSYEITSLQIFDMFPYTNHYETLMCLVRQRS